MRAVDLTQEKVYICADEVGVENPTRFTLKTFSNKEKFQVFGDMSISKEQTNISVEKAMQENLDGKDYLEFTEDVFEKIPFKYITEILSEIMNFNFLTEQDKKN